MGVCVHVVNEVIQLFHCAICGIILMARDADKLHDKGGIYWADMILKCPLPTWLSAVLSYIIVGIHCLD